MISAARRLVSVCSHIHLAITGECSTFTPFTRILATKDWKFQAPGRQVDLLSRALPELRRRRSGWDPVFRPHPQYGWDFPEEFRKKSGKTPETLSELFLEFPSPVQLGSPKAYNSRHLMPPQHFQNSLPVSTAGHASFFRSGSGEGLSELVMEFPAVLRYL